MGLLEVKHGLLQVAECLDFLHNNACLIHRAISPEVYTTLYQWHLCLLVAYISWKDSTVTDCFFYVLCDTTISIYLCLWLCKDSELLESKSLMGIFCNNYSWTKWRYSEQKDNLYMIGWYFSLFGAGRVTAFLLLDKIIQNIRNQ